MLATAIKISQKWFSVRRINIKKSFVEAVTSHKRRPGWPRKWSWMLNLTYGCGSSNAKCAQKAGFYICTNEFYTRQRLLHFIEIHFFARSPFRSHPCTPTATCFPNKLNINNLIKPPSGTFSIWKHRILRQRIRNSLAEDASPERDAKTFLIAGIICSTWPLASRRLEFSGSEKFQAFWVHKKFCIHSAVLFIFPNQPAIETLCCTNVINSSRLHLKVFFSRLRAAS